jgi:hypothetical protein
MACVNRAKISFQLAKFIIDGEYLKYFREKREEMETRISLWSFSTAASHSSTAASHSSMLYSFITGRTL